MSRAIDMTTKQEEWVERQALAFLEKMERQMGNLSPSQYEYGLRVILGVVECAHQAAKEDV
jgi:hypothetical protein